MTQMFKELCETMDEMESEMNIEREEKENKVTSDDGVIEFVCKPKNYGVIPEPIPANKVLPDWYRMLEGKMGEGVQQSTVKRCMPFLDALSMGWILPLAGEVEVEYDEKAGEFDLTWAFEDDLVSTHHPEQIGGDKNPMTNLPILKFHNHWAIKLPEGYSVLVTAPLNRREPRFKPFSGVVDVDNYFNYINAPFLWTGGSTHEVLEKGIPLVQVIPFKRDNGIGDAAIRSMDDSEMKHLETTKSNLNTEESLYRNNRWQSKKASRVVDRE